MNNNLKPVTTLPPFKRICMSIGELPTSYLETMTYYEMLVWFTEYMKNTVIPTINNNGEAVSELQSLYIQLHHYVENYFDNLDVQEEINNKLDEMAESGELTDIIAQYLGLAGMITFDTVADMKLAENLVNGSKCATMGYSAVNDGGNALYKVRTVTNDDVVDNSTIIALHNNLLVAELITKKINPDNFSGDNDNEKLQNAITYVENIYANGQETVTITLDRYYNITTTLIINKANKRFPLIFEGNGKGGFDISTTQLLFDSEETIISDITFNNITFKSTAGNGLVIMNSPKFINVKFINSTFKFIDCGVYSSTYIQAFQFINCTIAGGSGNFIEFVGSYYLTVNNSIIEHRTNSWFIKQNYSTETVHNKQFFTNIDGNLIEGFTGNSGIMYINNYETININNNYFESMPNTITHNQHDYGGSLNINNNRLFQSPELIENLNQKGFIYFEPSETNTYIIGNINISGNSIDNTYALYFHSTQINANDNYRNYKIIYGQNYVRNTFTSSYIYLNNQSKDAHFNILPVTKLTSGDNLYDRYQFDFIGKLYWTGTLTVNTKTYTIAYKLINGIFYINSQLISNISTSSSADNIYFGVDVHNDDIISCNIISSNCRITNYYRLGNVNGKYLYLQKIKDTGDPSDITLNCNLITSGMKG